MIQEEIKNYKIAAKRLDLIKDRALEISKSFRIKKEIIKYD